MSKNTRYVLILDFWNLQIKRVVIVDFTSPILWNLAAANKIHLRFTSIPVLVSTSSVSVTDSSSVNLSDLESSVASTNVSHVSSYFCHMCVLWGTMSSVSPQNVTCEVTSATEVVCEVSTSSYSTASTSQSEMTSSISSITSSSSVSSVSVSSSVTYTGMMHNLSFVVVWCVERRWQ